MTTLHIEATRNRLIGTLFAGNAILATAYIGVATVATLVAEEVTGSTRLSGLAATTGTLGVAAGAAVLSWSSLRFGRTKSFAAGAITACAGSVLVISSITASSLALLLVGMALVGAGRSVGQLARYAAGDLRTTERRAEAISLIVWASTIGAIVGPLLIGPTSAFGVTAGFNEYVGPTMIAVVGFALAAILLFIGLRPDPLSLAIGDDTGTHADSKLTPMRDLLTRPAVRLSIAAIVISQSVMVLVMVMTPVHIRANDGSLATVGWVMMAHAVGMFAIAPITGRLVGRFGPRAMIGSAVVTFIASCAMAASASTAATPVLIVSLFGLGVAWNFGFVAGSTLLQEGGLVGDRVRLQGFADASAWVTSAVAAAASGLVVDATSYSFLAIAGGLIALIPVLVMVRTRTA